MPELELTINGDVHTLDAPVGISLAQLLRERLGFTGTKIACDEGHCGACTVQVDGVPMLSCITLAHTVRGEVTTIEGLRDHPLIDAFLLRVDEAYLPQLLPYGSADVVARLAERVLAGAGAMPDQEET